MPFEPFLMERWQSTWEHHVDVNLSESGVEPLTADALIETDPDLRRALLEQPLHYVQTNGTPALRARIAALYPGATEDHVEVTTGGAEANQVVTWTLIEPGDEVVVMLPNYMQVWGLARAYGADTKGWRLVEDTAAGRWCPDMDALAEVVNERTRIIAICNPNNPTGSCLTADELDAIGVIADRVGAYVLADEIYRGAEISAEEETASMWGRAERVVITSGLSKAYGLPGLRIGWIAGPTDLVERCWERHDYTTIAPSALSDLLAAHALEPTQRARILGRTRAILRENYPVIAEWLTAHRDALTYVPPAAGAMLWLRYNHGGNSTELCERLRTEHGVLLVPGDHYGMDGFLRIGFGSGSEELKDGLSRVAEALRA